MSYCKFEVYQIVSLSISDIVRVDHDWMMN